MMSRPIRWLVTLLALALLPWLVEQAGGYVLYLTNLALVFGIAALGLNLLMGVAGQISIGHAGFMAVGAYTVALLMTRLNVPFALALPAAVLLAGALGFLLGLPALRLSGFYLAIATLGFGLGVSQVIGNLGPITGGPQGLRNLPDPALLDRLAGGSQLAYFYLISVILAGVSLFTRNLLRARAGRALLALRDSEVAAQAMGVDLARAKTLAFALSAAYAGLAGGLYAPLVGFISPVDFDMLLSLNLLAMIVVGGLASIPGSIAGALVLTLVPRLLFSRAEYLTAILTGALLIVMILFMPGGLVQAARALARRLHRAPGGKAPTA